MFNHSSTPAAIAMMLVAACAPHPALDTPEAAPTPGPAVVAAHPVSEGVAEPQRRLAIKTAEAFEIAPEDDRLPALVHPARQALFVAPVMIKVETATPFDTTPRGAMPAVVVNGKPLYESFFDPEDPTRISAILPDSRQEDVLVIQVGMNGDLEMTISEPVRIEYARLQ